MLCEDLDGSDEGQGDREGDDTCIHIADQNVAQ